MAAAGSETQVVFVTQPRKNSVSSFIDLLIHAPKIKKGKWSLLYVPRN